MGGRQRLNLMNGLFISGWRAVSRTARHTAVAFCIAAVGALSPLVGAEGPAPVITSIEPPSWWAGHTVNPVRVLIRGSHLQAPVFDVDSPALRVSSIRPNTAGTAVFLDVQIRRGTPSGKYELRLTNRGGSVAAPFHVLNPPARLGRFQGFDAEDVIYLIMPDRFADGDAANNNPPVSPGLFDRNKARFYHGGDFAGVQQRLGYLKELGVTSLWLTPWYDNHNAPNTRERYNSKNELRADGEAITDYHGYGAVNFYGVEEHFGTLDQLQELVEAAHGQRLKVIQDQVANHTGPFHPWVQDPPLSTWYHGSESLHLTNTWQTWTIPDPHASAAVRRSTLEGWFAGILPDLNQDEAECSRYLIQNALWWVGVTGVDGIRQDTLPYVPRSFWSLWSKALKREYPQLTLLGEMFDGDAAKVAFFQGGRRQFDGIDTGIDALFDFGLYYPLRKAYAEGGDVRQVAEQLGKDRLYLNPNQLVTFVGLHDVDRFMSVKGATVDGLKLAFTTLFTIRGIPLIYYGDELGLPGGSDPDNRRDFPGGFSGDARDAFTEGGRTESERTLHDHVRALATLRRTHTCLREGRQVNLWVEPQAWVYGRVSDQGRAVVAINNSLESKTVSFPVEPMAFRARQSLRCVLGPAGTNRVDRGELRLELPPRSGQVWIPTSAGDR